MNTNDKVLLPTREEVIDFLRGIGEIDGCSFGEKPLDELGNFWWRKYLSVFSAPADVAIVRDAAMPEDAVHIPDANKMVLGKENAESLTCGDSNVKESGNIEHVQDALSAEDLAKLFHDTYERIAPLYRYVTREESRMPWESVPPGNKALMIATCKEVQAALSSRAEPEGEITIVTNEAGECVAVTRTDEDHHILSVIWERA